MSRIDKLIKQYEKDIEEYTDANFHTEAEMFQTFIEVLKQLKKDISKDNFEIKKYGKVLKENQNE